MSPRAMAALQAASAQVQYTGTNINGVQQEVQIQALSGDSRARSPSAWEKQMANKIVDLGGLEFTPERRAEVVEQVRAAAELGVLYVRNFGVDVELIKELRAVVRKFFSLPVEEKAKAKPLPGDFRGPGYDTKYSKQGDPFPGFREFFRMACYPEAHRVLNQWPPALPEFKDTLLKYKERMFHATHCIAGLLAEGLGLPPTYIQDRLGELHIKALIAHSPPKQEQGLQGDKAIPNLSTHSDSNWFNINLPGDDGLTSKGLQFFLGGEWRDMPVFPNAALINIGEDLETISNGKYHAGVHRVLRGSQWRISILTTAEAQDDTVLAPAEELIHPDTNPAVYRTRRKGDRLLHLISAYVRSQPPDLSKGSLVFHPELLDLTRNIHHVGGQEFLDGKPLDISGATLSDD